jgi:hypothetical protein
LQDGYFEIKFPPTVKPLDKQEFQSYSKVDVYGDEKTFSIVLTENNTVVGFMNMFNAGSVAADITKDIIITISNIRNPTSIATSESFIVRVKKSTGIIEEVNSGLVVQTTLPGNIIKRDSTGQGFSMDASSAITEVDKQYSFTAELLIDVIYENNGGYLEIKRSTLVAYTPAKCVGGYGF